MATDIRRRSRRPKESSSELVWEDPGSSVFPEVAGRPVSNALRALSLQ